MQPRIKQMLKRLAIENPGIKAASGARFKMAAGIVYKKQLIATGVNKAKSHPMMHPKNGFKKGQIFLHAEMDAIKNALKLITQEELAKCDIYVVRVKRPESRSSEWIEGMAKPCSGCSQVIANFEIKNIHYTTE